MSYVDEILAKYEVTNAHEPHFLNAIREFLEGVRPAVEANEEKYRSLAILERMLEPERMICFRVPWVDENGNVQVNRGYRVNFNSALGPYKGGLRFHASVTQDMIKFLGFEMVFKDALTGLPIGGAKGGADFNPKGRSDRDVMAFCQSFMNELYRHIGPNQAVPAGDIGVGAREIGYLFGQYKRLSAQFDGTITGKAPVCGGSLARTEATGYGVVYMAEEVLASMGETIQGKKVVVSGAGNVATYTIEKLLQEGALPVTCSDSTGWIYDPDGIDIKLLKEVKEVRRARLTEYAAARPSAQYHEGRGVFRTPCDVCLPCATQGELTLEYAVELVANGVKVVCEGANMPTTLDAVEYFQKNKVVFVPGKAANAGGVTVSTLEMVQDAQHLYWSFEEVDNRLRGVMKGIYQSMDVAARKYGVARNFVAGANIAAFLKVAEAMERQGVV